jgi:hypothetical protein
LTVLKLSDGRWRIVFKDWISGYLPNDQPGDPLSWQRRYRFRSGASNGFDLELTLVPPERVPASLGDAEEFLPLQHPRCVLRYCPEFKAFRTLDEDFVRPPEHPPVAR